MWPVRCGRRTTTLGEYWLACEGTPELLFTENETNAERLWGGQNRTPLRQGRDQRLRWWPGDQTAVNPERVGTKVAAHYRLRSPPGATRDDPAAPLGRAAAPTPSPGAEETVRRPTGGGRPPLRRPGRRPALGGRGAGAAPGAGRADLVKQYYDFDVAQWLAGDPAGPPPPAARRAGAQRRLAPPQQRRRHLHAGQVGVPLVRRLGPGLPLRRLRAGRPRLRQGPAPAAAARVVHAPERPDPGLRVGLRRRQPARPRPGGAGALSGASGG